MLHAPSGRRLLILVEAASAWIFRRTGTEFVTQICKTTDDRPARLGEPYDVVRHQLYGLPELFGALSRGGVFVVSHTEVMADDVALFNTCLQEHDVFRAHARVWIEPDTNEQLAPTFDVLD